MNDVKTEIVNIVKEEAPRIAPAIGFLEESAGVRSSTRLGFMILLGLAAVLVAVVSAYVLRLGKDASAEVVAALATCLGAVVVNGAVAISKRNGGDNER